MSIREKLADKIINKSEAKWQVKKPNQDGKLVEVPDSLNDEILLEEIMSEGRCLGWITTKVESMENLLVKRDDSSKRRDGVSDHKNFIGRNLRSLSPIEYEEVKGHKKYLDKWRAEGIDI